MDSAHRGRGRARTDRPGRGGVHGAGARGPDVTSISVVAQDTGGLLKSLDAAGKRSLGDAILTAAGTAWPNASVSLLISDPGGGGTGLELRQRGELYSCV